MIKALMLDFGGVYFNDGYHRFISEIAKKHSIPRKKVVKIIHEHVDAEKWNKMSEKERNEFNENKQKKIEDLYIKK